MDNDDELLFALSGLESKNMRVVEESVLLIAQGPDEWAPALRQSSERILRGVARAISTNRATSSAATSGSTSAGITKLSINGDASASDFSSAQDGGNKNVNVKQACFSIVHALVGPAKATTANAPAGPTAAASNAATKEAERLAKVAVVLEKSLVPALWRLFRDEVEAHLTNNTTNTIGIVAQQCVKTMSMLTGPHTTWGEVLRRKCSPEDLAALSKYVAVLLRARKDTEQQNADDNESLVDALGLVEHLCLDNMSNARQLGMRLVRGLLALCAAEATKCLPLMLAALRALLNVTNECHEVIEAAAEARGVETCLVNIQRFVSLVLAARTGTARQEKDDADATFDAALVWICVLGNLVDMDGPVLKRAAMVELVVDNQKESERIVDAATFLAQTYVQALPPRAVAALTSGDTHSTIEFGWTPEELVLCAHVCMILGCFVREPKACDRILKVLPGRRGFGPLIQVLDAFLQFQSEAGVLTQEAMRSILKVAESLKKAHGKLMLPPPTTTSTTTTTATTTSSSATANNSSASNSTKRPKGGPSPAKKKA